MALDKHWLAECSQTKVFDADLCIGTSAAQMDRLQSNEWEGCISRWAQVCLNAALGYLDRCTFT